MMCPLHMLSLYTEIHVPSHHRDIVHTRGTSRHFFYLCKGLRFVAVILAVVDVTSALTKPSIAHAVLNDLVRDGHPDNGRDRFAECFADSATIIDDGCLR